MTPFHADSWLTVYQGDCREVMASMEPASVHCVVTSPPYWGLRDYGTATWIGGDEGCDHIRRNARRPDERRASTLGGGVATVAAQDAGVNAEAVCGKCGAIREDGQLGLEPTPEEYVANMVAVFREVRRVLRDDGTVWLNLGDSYANAEPRKAYGDQSSRGPGAMEGDVIQRDWSVWNLKQKDLAGMPWRVAFALQADGWYLRSDIIWSKPNPMPESVTDRPTKSHEYVFLLSKSARYWFDAEAVREPHDDKAGPVTRFGNVGANGGQRGGFAPDRAEHADEFTRPDFARRPGGREYNPAGRNIRSVWTVATQPYPGAHFATFPEKLVEPCIKAGCPDRVCPLCGAPWVRQTEVEYVKSPVHGTGSVVGRHYETGANNFDGAGMPRLNKSVTTTGWRASCDHFGDGEGKGVVLDPFAGSGTTGRVAQRLSRRAVLIDLNGEYLVQAMDRNSEIPLGLESA